VAARRGVKSPQNRLHSVTLWKSGEGVSAN